MNQNTPTETISWLSDSIEQNLPAPWLNTLSVHLNNEKPRFRRYVAVRTRQKRHLTPQILRVHLRRPVRVEELAEEGPYLRRLVLQGERTHDMCEMAYKPSVRAMSL